MSKKIFTAQSVEELQFILNKIDKLAICLPLNLSTQIYCIKHKIQFYNPIDFIDNNFYKDALIESEKLLEKLSFGELKFESHIKEYKAFIRFRFFSAIFLIEIIEKINECEKIDEIFISGWNRYEDQYSNNNYFVSDLISNLISNIKVSKLSNDETQKELLSEEKNYTFRNKKIDTKKNTKV